MEQKTEPVQNVVIKFSISPVIQSVNNTATGESNGNEDLSVPSQQIATVILLSSTQNMMDGDGCPSLGLECQVTQNAAHTKQLPHTHVTTLTIYNLTLVLTSI